MGRLFGLAWFILEAGREGNKEEEERIKDALAGKISKVRVSSSKSTRY
jgi:hypothetical protein